VFIALDQLEKLLGQLPRQERTIDYSVQGYKNVEGWIEPGIFSVILALDAIQNKLGFVGGALEIGIHQGQFFIALANLCDDSSDLVAVDVFEDQHKNIDNSGRGDEAAFRRNIDTYCNKPNDCIRTIKSDSLDLKVGAADGVKSGNYRFISIDGGHTAMHTYNDLLLAEQLVADGGVVFLDDILHHHWMGVMEGFMRYRLFSPGVLVPFLVTANKMVLCKVTHHGKYLEFFAKQFPMANKKAYRWTGDFIVVGNAPAPGAEPT
jgi:hypothetical protein